jgi:hypothetical protein
LPRSVFTDCVRAIIINLGRTTKPRIRYCRIRFFYYLCLSYQAFSVVSGSTADCSEIPA